jgi:hypothetical protein
VGTILDSPSLKDFPQKPKQNGLFRSLNASAQLEPPRFGHIRF